MILFFLPLFDEKPCYLSFDGKTASTKEATVHPEESRVRFMTHNEKLRNFNDLSGEKRPK